MMEKVYSYMNRLLEGVIAILMGFIVILMFSEVVSRYFFRAPIIWSEEMATYAFIWIIYIGSGVAFYRHAHIRVDYFSLKWSPGTMKRVELGLNLIMAFFFLFLLITGMKFAFPNFHVDSYTLPVIKLGWIYVAVPLGALLMLCNVARNLYLIYYQEKSGPE